jgi:CRP-like cAMP-binding protein
MNKSKSTPHNLIFQELDAEEISKFLGIARQVKFPKGTTIIREGELGETMYILAEGTVEVSKTLTLKKWGGLDYKEKEKILTKLSAADQPIFGEVALFENNVRTATVTALSDCVAWEVSRPDFHKLAEENPLLGYKIIKNIAKLLCWRLRKADEDTVKLTTALSLALRK